MYVRHFVNLKLAFPHLKELEKLLANLQTALGMNPKPTLMKLYENDPDNWDKYNNQVLASYFVTPHLATTETPFFLVYGRDPNLSLH